MFGKYRRLVIAVLLFIIIDLGLLLFNYFASQQLERDAERLTTAGELRMLSQQLTKSTLTMQTEIAAGLPVETSRTQAREAREGFVRGFEVLRQSLADDRDFIYFGIDVAKMRALLERAIELWGPIEREIQPLLADVRPDPATVELAVNKVVARHIRLANLLDDLTQQVKEGAERKVSQMRLIQISAILLAFVNFLYIVFSFIRRLRESDSAAERARQDTDDILGAVNEGLLLLKPDGSLGARTSASAERLLMRPCPPGASFSAWLDASLDPALASQAKDYIRLLFDPKVKPALLRQLDPLVEVFARSPDRPGEGRHLSFRFTQIRDADRVRELLVTVTDVTERVRLTQALKARPAGLGGSIEELLTLLEGDPDWMDQFLSGARARIGELNEALRSVSDDGRARRALIVRIAGVIHGIKGEASAIGLATLADAAHGAEDDLAPLRNRSSLDGEAMIGVALSLDKLADALTGVEKTFARLRRALGRAATGDKSYTSALTEALNRVAEQAAAKQGKLARVELTEGFDNLPEAMRRALREILPQLVRNAVVHGIESPEARARFGKAQTGLVRVDLQRDGEEVVAIEVSDDGGGLSLAQLREVARARGYDPQSLDERMLAELIFAPGVSTATAVTTEAGRGDGLSRVRSLLAELGARLRVSSQPGQFTRFTIELGAGA